MQNKLRILLAEKRMTVSDLHNLTGLSKTTLTSIYYERANPKVETIMKIAKALNVTFDELLGK
ncbi:helix-turn-helix domain-containing protein [Aerococcus sanguinicola]|uniref:helix-turn-helix domain-containing protein n=1 Tax=unclassified Aerococcus TaxID=2618060 RepID=UPI0008A249A8|nr:MULTISPECIES: helix-turn-helix transcriptional regulator [unclassified Aerococcus]MDK6856153.1 helix-turn-helix transcriptional regulator [Aerococcus sp. UMB7533]OFN02420.1 transcriptional regulator [Aerococcus sp. HMSC062A02]OHO45155.1 transcriptional regulator [Aerococcus sp. HMSC035B07]